MYEIVDLFPLCLYIGDVSCHEKFKGECVDALDNYEHEMYGNFMLLHNNPRFKTFFSSLKDNLNQYICSLGIDYTKLSYHVFRSWIIRKFDEPEEQVDINENRYDMISALGSHWHPGSDLSFIYYVSADETSDKLYFENCFANQNDLDGLLEISTVNNIVTEWNKYNRRYHIIDPKEGKIIIFPSKLNHAVRSYTRRAGHRIAISGDIIVTLTGLNETKTHPSLWKEL